MRTRLISLLLCTAVLAMPASAAVYLERDVFLQRAFGEVPRSQTLWLKGDIKQAVQDILGHDYRSLRVRYWQHGDKTAWVLDEIGKEQPITIGIVVAADHIEQVQILAFRESRGWEVRHPFFTEQFQGASFFQGTELDRPIDGISGATLSVKAVTKVSRLALYLHQRVLAASAL